MTVRRTTSSGRPRRPRGPGKITVLKDLITFGSGWALIWQQALLDREPSWPILLVAATLLGVPGASEVLARVWPGTGGSEPDSPPAPSSPLPSSPGGGGSDG